MPQEGRLTDRQLKANGLTSVLARSKEKLQRLTSEHRDLHGTVSKVGKAIDRNFVCDLSSTARNDVLVNERNVQLLNKVIAQHFYRQGLDDVAECIIRESALPRDEIYPEPFAELHRIWEAVQAHNLQPALDWAIRHSDELAAKQSTVEFKLHRLAFIQIVTSTTASQRDAITYARTYFNKFVAHFEKDIQILMGTLMYVSHGLENSPYRKLNAPEMWQEVADTFLKDACAVLGVNKDSPLSVVTNAGCTALPALLNLKQVMLSRQVLGIWSGRDELPVSD